MKLTSRTFECYITAFAYRINSLRIIVMQQYLQRTLTAETYLRILTSLKLILCQQNIKENQAFFNKIGMHSSFKYSYMRHGIFFALVNYCVIIITQKNTF
jgi:hypothetical protein